MTKILIKQYGSGITVKEFDVTGKSVRAQERLYDAIVMKTDLDRFYVTMECPDNKTE